MTTTTPHPLPDMLATPIGRPSLPQYTRKKIAAIWAAAALPMGLLAWVVAPGSPTGSRARARSPRR